MTEKQYTKVNMNLELNGKTYYNIKRRSDGFNICQVYGKYTADEILKELNNLHETNRKQSEIIDWLIRALRDDDRIFKEKGISYIVNNTLSDLVDGKITVTELLEEWDND